LYRYRANPSLGLAFFKSLFRNYLWSWISTV